MHVYLGYVRSTRTIPPKIKCEKGGCGKICAEFPIIVRVLSFKKIESSPGSFRGSIENPWNPSKASFHAIQIELTVCVGKS
jgi:hypothetical protein